MADVLALLLVLQDPYAIPYDKVAEGFRERVKRIREEPTLSVTIDRAEVKSTAEAYDFLLEELPFTAALVRAMGKSKYDIWSEAMVATTPAKDDAEREKRRHTYFLDDKDGMTLKATLVLREPTRWVYYTYGKYSGFEGRSVIVVSFEKKGDALSTEARVYTEVEDGIARIGAELFSDEMEETIKEKATVFVEAARTVAEAAAADPEKLVRVGKAAKDVDGKILEAFRAKFPQASKP